MAKRDRNIDVFRKLTNLAPLPNKEHHTTAEKRGAWSSHGDDSANAGKHEGKRHVDEDSLPGTGATNQSPEKIRSRQEVRTARTLKERSMQMSVYLERPLYRRLRECANREETKMHPIIIEGILMALAKRDASSK
jgi:hypothetical protein